MSSGEMDALDPKAPPTWGEIRCTWSCASPKARAMSAWARAGDWLPNHTLRRWLSPCHWATQARGSMAMANKRGTVKSARATTATCPCACPWVCATWCTTLAPGSSVAPAGKASSDTCTNKAASCAVAASCASTMATACPTCSTKGPANKGMGMSCKGGHSGFTPGVTTPATSLACHTATTPGRSSAALASTSNTCACAWSLRTKATCKAWSGAASCT